MRSDVITPEILSSLIGSIYDCAINPDNWNATLDELRQAFRAHNGQLTLVDVSTNQILLDKAAGIPAHYRQMQPGYMGDLYAFWSPALNDPTRAMTEPLVGSRAADSVAWQNNRYVQEWANPQGIVDVVGAMVFRDSQRIASIGLGRHASYGTITDREVDLMRLLSPHIQRAVTISNMLELATIAAATFESTLDSLTVGVFLVDAHMRLIHANRAGHDMLAKADPLRLDMGVLKTWLPATTAALLDSVILAGRNRHSVGRTGIGIPAPGPQGSNAVATVLPLAEDHDRRRWISGAVAAIFVGASANPAPIPIKAMTALYDLTPAEARVLEQIASGLAIAQIAQGIGVADSTVKTHLSSLFGKTGTSRQIDLVRLVSTMTLPVQA
jgi:DNA-binding CsgD family transcriptional regulator/PAS domain-containing protein